MQRSQNLSKIRGGQKLETGHGETPWGWEELSTVQNGNTFALLLVRLRFRRYTISVPTVPTQEAQLLANVHNQLTDLEASI